MVDVREQIQDYEEEIAELQEGIKERMEYESLVGFDPEIGERIISARKRIKELHEWIDYLRRYEEK
jgi:uncharacterized protein (UPF0335 family)